MRVHRSSLWLYHASRRRRSYQQVLLLYNLYDLYCYRFYLLHLRRVAAVKSRLVRRTWSERLFRLLLIDPLLLAVCH